MKLNTKIIILAYLCCTSVFANMKYYGQGIITEHFEMRDVPLPQELRKNKNISVNSNRASTSAVANPVSGKTGNIMATGKVNFNIINDAEKTQNYVVNSFMCIENEHCFYNRDNIELAPHNNTGGNGDIFIVQELPIGTYEDEAIIQIFGSDPSFAEDSNTVTVT